jgi:ribosomal protein S18 acetylase RimI-like enzyme
MAESVEIRALNDSDPEIISAAFSGIGAGKPVEQYRRYLAEQCAGTRTCLVATLDRQFAGYVTVSWVPKYTAFVEQQIPEIQDLNVLPGFRRRGLATRLLDRAEEEISLRSSVAGIGVGLHPGYNQAQSLYVKRGYIPDGRGVTYRNRYVEEGASVMLDDDLVLHLTKRLTQQPVRDEASSGLRAHS